MEIILCILLLIIGVTMLTAFFYFSVQTVDWFRKNKKKVGAIITTVSIASAGYILIPHGDISASGGIIEGNSVVWENEYAKLTVTPHTATNIIRQEEYLDILWKYPDMNVDIALRFSIQLNYKNIWIWKNISHNVSVPDYGNIFSNYTLFNITCQA